VLLEAFDQPVHAYLLDLLGEAAAVVADHAYPVDAQVEDLPLYPQSLYPLSHRELNAGTVPIPQSRWNKGPYSDRSRRIGEFQPAPVD
jgi:hypothetical protein